MFDRDLLNLYIDKGLISVQKHPECDLYIYNYSPKAQYEKVWDEITTACRGLILDGEGNVIARPFPKFFNLEEHSRSDIVFSKPFKIYEKLDGSLGIMYRVPETTEVGIATRGSFTSPQAIRATKIYQQKYGSFKPAEGTTPLFEIIYPGNRIVIDYGDREELVLLTVINNLSGRDVPDVFWVGPRAPSYSLGAGFEDTKPRKVLEHLGIEDDGNNEGVVLVFDWPKKGPKTRVKLKLDEYKRLHRILTGISTKSIWETLRNGDSLTEILDKVPDEFYEWVQETSAELQAEYHVQLSSIKDSFALSLRKLCPGEDDEDKCLDYARKHRKEYALVIAKDKHKGLFFSLLDGKNISNKIWDMCRPEFEKAFSKDEI